MVTGKERQAGRHIGGLLHYFETGVHRLLSPTPYSRATIPCACSHDAQPKQPDGREVHIESIPLILTRAGRTVILARLLGHRLLRLYGSFQDFTFLFVLMFSSFFPACYVRVYGWYEQRTPAAPFSSLSACHTPSPDFKSTTIPKGNLARGKTCCAAAVNHYCGR